MSDLMIEVESLTKDYGYTRAVDKVSFSVRRGEVLGFLGPNGAGKSTTMKILTCFLAPTAGRAVVAGHDVFDDSLEVRKRVGYLPEDTPIYRDMTVVEFLQFAAEMRGMDRHKAAGRIKEIGTRCGLGDVAGKLVGELSKGFRQRVGLAQAILHDPDIVILDEPTSGLDPNQIVEIRSLIKEIGREKTVILSTHILPEVQATCSRVVIISGGKLVADGTPDELRARERGGRYRVVVEIERRPQGRHPRTARQPGRGHALRGDRGRGRLAHVRDRRGRRPATCASRSSARPSTTAGRCWSWGASPPAWKTFSVTSPPEKRSSHEPRNGHCAAGDPHLFQFARRVHRRHACSRSSRATVLHAAVRGEAGRACAASSSNMPMLFMFLAPAITMRLLADEKSSGTLELLITMPVRDWEVVVGKFLAAMALLVTTLALTLVFAITVRALGPLDRGPAIGGYLGLLLMGGAYVSIGVMGSAFTRNSIVAFIIAFAISFVLFLFGQVTSSCRRPLQPLASFLGIGNHFENISRGVIDTRDVIYYLSVMGVCLLLATLSLESRRWR